MASSTQWTWMWANSEMAKDKDAWRAVVHGVAKGWTQLSGWQQQQQRQWFQGWFGDSVKMTVIESGFSEQKEGRKSNTNKLSKFSFSSFFFFKFLNQEANLVPEIPQQTHTYAFIGQTPSWKGYCPTSIDWERKGEVCCFGRAPRSPANTLYCCRNLGSYKVLPGTVATSRVKMQCIPSFSKD